MALICTDRTDPLLVSAAGGSVEWSRSVQSGMSSVGSVILEAGGRFQNWDVYVAIGREKLFSFRYVSPSASEITLVSPTTGIKFVSPSQRGTM